MRQGELNIPEEIWQQELSPESYRVMRQHGTERPFQNAYWDNKEPGIYLCAATGIPLFTSETKFDSGTGWPSFYAPIDEALLAEQVDYNIGYARREVYSPACGGHLGHVFEDGPAPTGLRYCMNSAALRFVPLPEGQSMDELIAEHLEKARQRLQELKG